MLILLLLSNNIFQFRKCNRCFLNFLVVLPCSQIKDVGKMIMAITHNFDMKVKNSWKSVFWWGFFENTRKIGITKNNLMHFRS